LEIGRRERVEAKIILLSKESPQLGVVNFVVKSTLEKRYAKFFLKETGLCKAPLRELEKAFEENRIITLVIYRLYCPTGTQKTDYIARTE
jgi:hypothetical protein